MEKRRQSFGDPKLDEIHGAGITLATSAMRLPTGSSLPRHPSMDWFVGENFQETHGFVPLNSWGFPVIFSLNQSIASRIWERGRTKNHHGW